MNWLYYLFFPWGIIANLRKTLSEIAELDDKVQSETMSLVDRYQTLHSKHKELLSHYEMLNGQVDEYKRAINISLISAVICCDNKLVIPNEILALVAQSPNLVIEYDQTDSGLRMEVVHLPSVTGELTREDMALDMGDSR